MGPIVGAANAMFNVRLSLADQNAVRLWRAARRPPTGASVDVSQDCPGVLFSLLRVACAESTDWDNIEQAGVTDAHGVQRPISVRLEGQVLRRLFDMSRESLARLMPVIADTS